MKASVRVMLEKLKIFWHAPLLNKMHTLSTLYYRMKGIVVYRFLFKEFGKSSCIRRPLLILNPAFIKIGERVSIRDGVRLEIVRSSNYRVPCLSIESDTNIEQNVHIVCHNRIRIGRRVSVTGHCSIVDVTHPYYDVHESTKIGARIKDEDSFVDIGDGSFIGFGSVILPNVRIGVQAVIGANSVVTADVPDYSVAAGAPAIVLKHYDWERQAWVNTTPCAAAQTDRS
jgi:acetyltransferase-like isoleucine patch superfamily enzyme